MLAPVDPLSPPAGRLSAPGAPKAQYLPSPFLDERYQQNKVSVSPFSSGKRHKLRVEKVYPPNTIPTYKRPKSEEEYRDRHGMSPYFSCKMTYPAALTQTHHTVPMHAASPLRRMADDDHPTETDGDEEVARSETSESVIGFRDPFVTNTAAAFSKTMVAPQPNAYWLQPPPTLNPLPDYVNRAPNLKKDDWHPLLANATAAATVIARLQEQEDGASPFSKVGSMALDESTIADRTPSVAGSGGSVQPNLTQKAALLLSKAIHSPLPSHTIPANAALAANRTRAATTRGVQFRPSDRQRSDVQTNNNYHNKTFHDMNNICIPPPPAFRNLSPKLRHILQARGNKTRSRVEVELQSTNPVVEPPLRPLPPEIPLDPDPEVEEDEDEQREFGEGSDEEAASTAERDDSDSHSSTGLATPQAVDKKPQRREVRRPDRRPSSQPGGEDNGKTQRKVEVRYDAETGHIQFLHNDEDEDNGEDEGAESSESEVEEEWEYCLEEALGKHSNINLWNSCVFGKCEQENCDIDPTYSPSAVEDVVGKRRVKLATGTLSSVYNATSRRPGFIQYMTGRGLRMGSGLTNTTPASSSSFTTELPQNLKDMAPAQVPGTVGPTPPAAFACHDDPNAFVFKDSNLISLLEERGGEVEEINLEGMGWLADSAFHKIGDYCPNVKLLNLRNCVQLTTKSLVHIARQCQLLAYLNITGCSRVTGEALSAIFSNCAQLEVLSVHAQRYIDTDLGSSFLMLHRCRSLRALDLSYCTNLSDQALMSIANYCPSLEMIDLSGCPKIGDIGAIAIGSKCSNLSVLVMKLCSQSTLTNAGLHALSRAPRNLKRLDLAGVTQLEDDTLKKLLAHMPCLRYLSIAGCRLITDESIRMLNTNCRQLQRLDLSSCDTIQLQTLLDLIHDVPSLVRLVVSESCISNAEVKMLSEVRPRCKILKNQFAPPPRMKTVAFKPIEERRKRKAPAKKSK